MRGSSGPWQPRPAGKHLDIVPYKVPLSVFDGVSYIQSSTLKYTTVNAAAQTRESTRRLRLPRADRSSAVTSHIDPRSHTRRARVQQAQRGTAVACSPAEAQA